MKAVIRTTITQYSVDGYIKPKAAIFFMRNDSWQPVLINGKLLPPQATFGISGIDLVANDFENGKVPENDTQFNIVFPPSTDQLQYRQSLQLVETFIEFIK